MSETLCSSAWAMHEDNVHVRMTGTLDASITCSNLVQRIPFGTTRQHVSQLLEHFVLICPAVLQPLSQRLVGFGQSVYWEPLHVCMKLQRFVESGYTHCLPNSWRSHEVLTSRIGYCYIIHGLDLGCTTKLFDRSDKSFGSRMQRVTWNGLVMGFAPLDSFGMLSWSKAS